MRFRLPVLAVSTIALAACGGGYGGGGSAAPAGLVYTMPSPATARYSTADTVDVGIDAMGQMMQVSQSQSATVAVTFTSAGDGVGVSLAFEDFSARVTQPMGAPITADESGIEGPLVFSMDRKGNVTPGTHPVLRGNAAELFPAMSTTYSFFPGLPGTGVGVGDMWRDTVSYAGSEGAGEVDVVAAFEYTVVGDTVVGGRSLMKINVVGDVASNMASSVQGMDVSQSITATATGHVLWDLQAGLMYEQVMMTEGDGGMEVSVAPVPMGIQVRGKSVTRLIS